MQRYGYICACAAWLAGACVGTWRAGVDFEPLREMPAVSGNNWGQHAPRAGTPPKAPATPAIIEDTPVETAVAPSSLDSLRANRVTERAPEARTPRVPATSYVDSRALLWGDVQLGEGVLVAPFVSVRADEGMPIFIGDGSSLQDGVVVHGLGAQVPGGATSRHVYTLEGRPFSVYVARDVSVEHQAQLHGPVWIEEDVWVGMQALVSGSHVGRGVVIEPRAAVLGVRVPAHRYVPAGVVVNRQAIAERLPEITASYPLRSRNRAARDANRALVEAYTRAAP